MCVFIGYVNDKPYVQKYEGLLGHCICLYYISLVKIYMVHTICILRTGLQLTEDRIFSTLK
jgi:hypothetical protein